MQILMIQKKLVRIEIQGKINCRIKKFILGFDQSSNKNKIFDLFADEISIWLKLLH